METLIANDRLAVLKTAIETAVKNALNKLNTLAQVGDNQATKADGRKRVIVTDQIMREHRAYVKWAQVVKSANDRREAARDNLAGLIGYVDADLIQRDQRIGERKIGILYDGAKEVVDWERLQKELPEIYALVQSYKKPGKTAWTYKPA